MYMQIGEQVDARCWNLLWLVSRCHRVGQNQTFQDGTQQLILDDQWQYKEEICKCALSWRYASAILEGFGKFMCARLNLYESAHTLHLLFSSLGCLLCLALQHDHCVMNVVSSYRRKASAIINKAGLVSRHFVQTSLHHILMASTAGDSTPYRTVLILLTTSAVLWRMTYSKKDVVNSLGPKVATTAYFARYTCSSPGHYMIACWFATTVKPCWTCGRDGSTGDW